MLCISRMLDQAWPRAYHVNFTAGSHQSLWSSGTKSASLKSRHLQVVGSIPSPAANIGFWEVIVVDAPRLDGHGYSSSSNIKPEINVLRCVVVRCLLRCIPVPPSGLAQCFFFVFSFWISFCALGTYLAQAGNADVLLVFVLRQGWSSGFRQGCWGDVILMDNPSEEGDEFKNENAG